MPPLCPTTPHTPPARLLKKYQAKGVPVRIAKYYAMCEWFDETCGALVEHIDGAGIGKNTLIIYVTDNGWIQTETGSYAERSKLSPYEGGTRTPIMFRWPGTIPAADRPELCSSIDIVPTILAAASATGPHHFPGLNLLAQLKSGDAIDRDNPLRRVLCPRHRRHRESARVASPSLGDPRATTSCSSPTTARPAE